MACSGRSTIARWRSHRFATHPAAGNRLVEIDRMLHFATELKQPFIFTAGASHRPEAAALLKKSDTRPAQRKLWPEKTRDADRTTWTACARRETRDKAASAAGATEGGVKSHSTGRPGAARNLQRREEGDRQRTLAKTLRALTPRPPKSSRSPTASAYREGEDRQSGGHAQEIFDVAQGRDGVRGWQKVQTGSRRLSHGRRGSATVDPVVKESAVNESVQQ
jgi:hypothetical protein